jgi:hypothetical protein
MKALPEMTLRIGFGAAVFNIIGGIAYLVILTIIIATGTPQSDAGAPPLIAASLLMLIGPLGLIPLWTAIHLSTTEDKRIFSLVSLVFAALFAAATSINRWVHLTVVRESLSGGLVQGLEWFTPYGEHSIMFALEMLAYGWFLGFSLLAMAPVFQGRSTRLEDGLFWTLLVSGVLCLLGGIGELVEIKSILIFMTSMIGWALGLGLINILLAIWFYRQYKHALV